MFRGPQGTFVGKNVAGVAFNTRVPELGKTYASLEGAATTMPTRTLIANAGWVTSRCGLGISTTSVTTYDPSRATSPATRAGRQQQLPPSAKLWEPNDQAPGILKVDYHDLDFGGNDGYGEEPP